MSSGKVYRLVTETVSPLDGYSGPAPDTVPDKLIEAVPNEIACEPGE